MPALLLSHADFSVGVGPARPWWQAQQEFEGATPRGLPKFNFCLSSVLICSFPFLGSSITQELITERTSSLVFARESSPLKGFYRAYDSHREIA